MYLLIAGVFGSAFVIFLIETKKINKHTFKQAARFVILVLLIYLYRKWKKDKLNPNSN